MLHVPMGYLTKSEKSMLDLDERGGVRVLPQSRNQELLVVGFVILRALLGKVIPSWVRLLAMDLSPGGNRARHNLQTIGAAVYMAMSRSYKNHAMAREVDGIVEAVGAPVERLAATKGKYGPQVVEPMTAWERPDIDEKVISMCEQRIAHLARWLCGGEPAPTIGTVPDALGGATRTDVEEMAGECGGDSRVRRWSVGSIIVKAMGGGD